jgi:hypothetical protein
MLHHVRLRLQISFQLVLYCSDDYNSLSCFLSFREGAAFKDEHRIKHAVAQAKDELERMNYYHRAFEEKKKVREIHLLIFFEHEVSLSLCVCVCKPK